MSISAMLAGPAAAADQLLPETRPLFLSERFTPTSIRGAVSGEQPTTVLALAGESEGLHLALRNTTAGTLRLQARLGSPDAGLVSQMTQQHIGVEYLRVGFVRVPQGSTGTGTAAGSYADPLPPIAPGSSAGLLSIAPGQWGAATFMFHIRTDAAPAVYTMNLELFASNGQGGETVYARVPATLDVRQAWSKSGAAQPLLQPGGAGAMKTVLGIEGDAYWLGDSAMRNGPSAGFPTFPDRMAQLQGLMAFYGEHNVTPISYPLATPSASGSYSGCGFDSPPNGGDVPNVTFATQLSRYLATPSLLTPGALAFPTRIVPDNTPGCIPENTSDDYEPLYDPRNTPSVKQDDSVKSNAKTFWATLNSRWSTGGWYASGNTYVMNPFDEPSDTTAAMRATMNTQVPLANTQLRSALQARAKSVLAGWPRDNRTYQQCKVINGTRSCVTVQRDTYSNRKMWDGSGSDEVRVWMPPFSRLYGRTNDNPKLVQYGVNRNTEYRTRLAGIRKLTGGRETWGYNFFTATNLMPQLTIDAPATDARVQYWALARDGHTGLFVSNSMIGWGSTNQNHPGTNIRRKGNPYDGALYFKHNTYGYAAGWGTFIYPPYRPDLGLTSEAARNTSDSRPVSSLRMEGMLQGSEDANLTAMYRARFGEANVQARMKAIFPGSYRNLPKALGNSVYPAYSSTNLAQRMEKQRRTMIRALAAHP